ncbi:MAG: nucleotidyltransferase domain-containing protein [Deltaproteobacteria bacterium]|nr:nucleotidyltransferase domain-containing protein [Deltaproteobacteria bacterium]
MLDSVLNQIVNQLIKEFHPEKVYLFGSRSRGDFNSDSDIDLMLIVPTALEPQYRRMQKAQQVLWRYKLTHATDVLIWTKEEFERTKNVVCSLPATILREGKLLYEAS